MEEYQDVDVKFDDVVEFDRETVALQKCAAKKEWKTFKEKINTMKLLETFDLFKNTVLHAVARSSGNAELLEELLEKLPEEQQGEALRKGNVEGNTLLHEAVMNKDSLGTVDVIMRFGRKILPNEYQELLKIRNDLGETPVFRAAWRGHLNVLKHIHKNHQLLQADEHFRPDRKFHPILHVCLIKFKFDVAIWLVKKVDRKLAQQKSFVGNAEGFTCFQLLSKMQLAFRSIETQQMKFREKFIYYMLPDEGCESELELDGAGNNSFKSTRDIESDQPDDNDKPPKSIFSRVNYAAWKLLARGFNCVDEIWDQKKRHMDAEHLAKLLVKNKDSWEYRYIKDTKPLKLVRDFPSNVTEKKKEIELEMIVKKVDEKIIKKEKQLMLKIWKQRTKSEEEENEVVEEIKATISSEIPLNNDVKDEETKWETPLFYAAASGIKEVVEIIVDYYPEAISHVNEKGLNILHMAIKHRQLEIYEIITRSAAFKALKPRISNNGRTILHQAASMEYYREQALPGVAYQLQDELDWYHRVESILPKHYRMHCDDGGLTAGDLLDIEHAEMHDQAKQWMKETAQSCSTVAVLIAGVVFAAAYTIPGGTSKNGKAELLNTPAVQFFTVMDVMALACSLGSVVMFLSILTSSFDLWDFHKSLPQKLKLGFIMLFCALITTILAFAATILLTVHMEGNKKTTTFIYSLAFIVVSVFGLTQFPLYKMFEDEVKQCTQRWKKVTNQV